MFEANAADDQQDYLCYHGVVFLSILLYSSVSISLCFFLTLSAMSTAGDKGYIELKILRRPLNDRDLALLKCGDGSKQNSRTASGTDIDNASRALNLTKIATIMPPNDVNKM